MAKFLQRGEDLDCSFAECWRLLQEARRRLGHLEEQIKREEEDEEPEAELKKVQAESVQPEIKKETQQKHKTFVEKYAKEMKHFGTLRRWDDSQKYLSDNPHLVCEESANDLVVLCIDFEIDEEMQRSFDEKNTEMLQDVMSKLHPEEGRYHLQRCIDSGLWVPDLQEEED